MSEELKQQLNRVLNMKGDIKLESKAENEYSLYIYGSIGGFFGDNSAQSIRRKLSGVEANKIHVHINSGGGSAFDGIAISNFLKNHKAEIIVHVDGWAASAASIIAMAGDKIIMPSNTVMMIHRASTIAIGNAGDFEKVANDLKKIDSAVTATYENRFVGEREELVKLLEDETFLTADEALAFGLADEVGEEIEIKDPDDIEDEEKEPENFKDSLVAKYAAQVQKKPENQQQDPQSIPDEDNSQLKDNAKIFEDFLNAFKK
ncbi:Clp protease ClpP [Virgibacillus salarius]|uniref:head maturation protease, ClpP-related n=1 Tax=Virgibacillus salarius TaxID=447199 RepID=UPI002492E9F5|nr:head maturation protease, ClpP-related [Virgibacillus salarius]WBX80128.1 Clp protease ClpP [Virgibacillus salarius]